MHVQLDLFGQHQEVREKPKLPYALEILNSRVPPADAPIVVSYGGGRNSTAMLIGMWSKGIIPDLILFADTGGEKPETYEYLQIFSDWLTGKGMPPVTVTSRQTLGMNKHEKYSTLEECCLINQTLPSKAYGGSTCSLNWKAEPQNKFLKTWKLAQDTWKRGELVRKFIGFHAGEISRLFNRKSGQPYLTSDRCFHEYPLVNWGWHQGHCEAIIEASGLPMPPKSACFYCPNMRAKEIRELAQNHPDLFQRAIAMERNAQEKNNTVKGLGRDFSWEELIESSKPNEYFVSSVIPDCMCNDG